MVIFPLAPDQTIAQRWSNGVRGGVQETRWAYISHGASEQVNTCNMTHLHDVRCAVGKQSFSFRVGCGSGGGSGGQLLLLLFELHLKLLLLQFVLLL